MAFPLLPVLAAVALLAGSSFVQAQNISCTCRYQGQDYGIGESICLKGANGMRMATCAMVLNNTSWKFSNAPCPLSSWNGPLPPAGPDAVPPAPTRVKPEKIRPS